MGRGTLRRVEFYVDAAGKSEPCDALDQIAESDRRAHKAIRNRLRMLTEVDLREALGTPLLKQPTATIYVLRARRGSVSYRFAFFESPCHAGRLVVIPHTAHRSVLRGDRYKQMIEAAERRRQDWIRRNC